MTEIRRAILTDAEALQVYMSALVGENLDTIGMREPPTLEKEQEYLRKAEESERAFFLLAFDGARIIGMLDLWAGTRSFNRHTARFGMSVAKDWRGKGVGRKLLDAAIAEAKKWDGFCRLELECATHNIAAIKLYESSGFVTEARKRKSLNLRASPEDGLLMALVW